MIFELANEEKFSSEYVSFTVDMLGELINKSNVKEGYIFMHPHRYTDIRAWGRDHLNLIEDPDLLKKGHMAIFKNKYIIIVTKELTNEQIKISKDIE